ncbi:MAG: M23 family metallopeptidase [Marinicella sp.]
MTKILTKLLLTLYVVSVHSAEYGGGGSAEIFHQDKLSEFEQMNRWSRYIKDREELIHRGLLTISPFSGLHAMYDFPLTTDQSYPSYYGISNFVDLDLAAPDMLEDYNCGMRTYDLDSGYNHGGIDIFTWPYSWHKMDHDEVQIVAAEAGTITTKIDGNYDRSCSFDDPLNTGWNAVYVTHADGSYAWYGHMKNGSLTTKSVGETVVVGEYLGVVGSSGNSTGPHLHFETHDFLNNVIEPYFGLCNATTADSWWRTQKPYYESKINQLMTHPNPPSFPTCPATVDTPDESQFFEASDRVYLAAYYSDQLDGQLTSYEVLRPDDTVASSWTHASTFAHYAASYWYWYIDLSALPQNGRWIFRATYEGQDVEQYFWVGDLIFGSSFE